MPTFFLIGQVLLLLLLLTRRTATPLFQVLGYSPVTVLKADVKVIKANMEFLQEYATIFAFGTLADNATIDFAYDAPGPTWPPVVGDTWTFTKHTTDALAIVNYTVHRQGKVLEKVDVYVPAGTFNCWHIVETDTDAFLPWALITPNPNFGDVTYEHWFNEEVIGSDVKMVDNDTYKGTETRVLTSWTWAPPPVESITPNVLGNSKNNKAVPVEIIRATGPAFALKAKVQLIQVGALKPKKKTVKIVSLTATEIDGLANVVKLPPGPYDVVVTNKDKSVWTLASGMTVTPAPTIDKAVKPATNPTPPSAPTNTNPQNITITGTNFQPNATVKVYLIKKGIETDIPISSIVVVNSNTITCNLNLTGAVAGSWKGLITNPDDNGQGAFKFKVLK